MNNPYGVGHNNPPVERTRDVVLMEWMQAQSNLEYYKKTEAALRKEATALSFPKPKSGTNKLDLGGGYELKLNLQAKYKVEKHPETGDYAYIQPYLEQLAAISMETAQTIVRWKPEVSASVYKKLTEAERAIVNQFVVEDRGSSTLELKVPPTNAG